MYTDNIEKSTKKFKGYCLTKYIDNSDNMSNDFKEKMLTANTWKDDEVISLEDFVEFMAVNYRFEYDGLEYDPDFGKLVQQLDEEQHVINEK